MKAGADFAAVSMHKSGGSLTQSSFLLTADTVNEGYVRQIINLMPVSYTHLDVYKRQPISSMPDCVISFSCPLPFIFTLNIFSV